MTLPFLYFSEGCCIPEATSRSHLVDCTSRSALITDSLIVISTLAIGILGILGIIGMPTPAAYALIGIGGYCILSWCAMILHCLCQDTETIP